MKSVKQHIRETISLSIPVIIGQVGHVMMGVVDNAMVGQVSPFHLAAASIANGIFFIFLVVGLGISYAISPLVAMTTGSGDKAKSSAILRHGFYINMVSAVILTTLSFFAAGLIPYMHQSPEVTKLAVSYTRILSFSAIPVMIFQTYRQFSEGLSIMRPPMIITIAANFFHAAANYVLIYGHFGFPRLELNGAGYATLFSRSLMAIAMVLIVLKTKRFREYEFKILPISFNWEEGKRILVLGLGSGFQYFFEVGCFVFAAIMIGWIGPYEQAAHQIAMNVASISYMVVIGISAAGTIRVGNAVGSKSILHTRRAGFSALGLAFGFMVCSGISLIFLRSLLPHLYVDNQRVIDIASQLLFIAALFQIFDGTQAVGLGILRGITDVKFPTIMTFISYWIICVPIAYLLGFVFHWGVVGVWIGLLIGLATSATSLSIRFALKSKKIPV
jgi:MATE family multidrug resistance protein